MTASTTAARSSRLSLKWEYAAIGAAPSSTASRRIVRASRPSASAIASAAWTILSWFSGSRLRSGSDMPAYSVLYVVRESIS